MLYVTKYEYCEKINGSRRCAATGYKFWQGRHLGRTPTLPKPSISGLPVHHRTTHSHLRGNRGTHQLMKRVFRLWEVAEKTLCMLRKNRQTRLKKLIWDLNQSLFPVSANHHSTTHHIKFRAGKKKNLLEIIKTKKKKNSSQSTVRKRIKWWSSNIFLNVHDSVQSAYFYADTDIACWV